MNRFTRRDVGALSMGALTGLAAAEVGGTPPQTVRAVESKMSGSHAAIPYSRFEIYKVVNNDLDSAPEFPFPFVAGSKFKAVNTGIDQPAVQVNFEDFYPGPDIVWSMFHDEVQYVTSGRAEITFHLPPLMQESGTVTAEAGSIYLLPRGARIVWRVLGDMPFRHLCICIPNPGYPIPVAESVSVKPRTK
jgi:mannose-6-phosphate isomerase-like protein (cupin superfamily)